MSWSGCSATSGSRLFMSIRMAASCGQPRQVSAVPWGARTGRGPEVARPAGVAVIGGSSSSRLLGSVARPAVPPAIEPDGITGLKESSSPAPCRATGPGGRGGPGSGRGGAGAVQRAGAVEGAGEDGPDVGRGGPPRRIRQHLIVEGVRGDDAEIGGGAWSPLRGWRG